MKSNARNTRKKYNPRYSFENDYFSVWVLLDYTKFAISKVRDAELAKIGLTPQQAAVIRIILRRKKATITEISRTWMRRPHSISTIIDRMARQGLVKKIKHPGNRELEIEVTEKGEKLYHSIKIESLEAVFSSLSKDDIQKLSQYLKLLLIRACAISGDNYDFPFLL
ncbi:MAG: hypothetical protein A2144_07110 [Chloroflexi bacterium RBG_16_50_9]|nr:MAG: hypothetical protein A2144_07110 [Chloroflexi bacterium RBG_16_50_9]